MKIEDEDFTLDYSSRNELSYIDDNLDTIEILYNNDKYTLKVWIYQDEELNKREYILINHGVIYLDGLKRGIKL